MINTQTKLCCVIGNPIEHSFSPVIHNAGIKALGLNYVYLAFKIIDLKAFILSMKTLNIRGASVTIPHKIEVMKYLDAIDKNAKLIGAVNTIVNENGALKGYNSDVLGAIKALKEVTSISGKKVVILGAGGASRALIVGLKEENAKITILNRNLEKARRLAKTNGLKQTGTLNNLDLIRSSDILVNTTPVGMDPDINTTPVPAKYLHQGLVVFDVVYNPKKTRLIKEALKKRCQVVYGYKMLLYQALTQFELFTGEKPPAKVMEKVLGKVLKGGK